MSLQGDLSIHFVIYLLFILCISSPFSISSSFSSSFSSPPFVQYSFFFFFSVASVFFPSLPLSAFHPLLNACSSSSSLLFLQPRLRSLSSIIPYYPCFSSNIVITVLFSSSSRPLCLSSFSSSSFSFSSPFSFSFPFLHCPVLLLFLFFSHYLPFSSFRALYNVLLF